MKLFSPVTWEEKGKKYSDKEFIGVLKGYDEESGKLFFYPSTLSPNNEGYYIESVSEDEIVMHCDFGILPQWQYEMENGLEYYP